MTTQTTSNDVTIIYEIVIFLSLSLAHKLNKNSSSFILETQASKVVAQMFMQLEAKRFLST